MGFFLWMVVLELLTPQIGIIIWIRLVVMVLKNFFRILQLMLKGVKKEIFNQRLVEETVVVHCCLIKDYKYGKSKQH